MENQTESDRPQRKKRNLFLASYGTKGRTIMIGRFSTSDAAVAAAEAAREGAPLTKLRALAHKDVRSYLKEKKKERGRPEYFGVIVYGAGRGERIKTTYGAAITFKKRLYSLGCWHTAKKAAIAYDRAARYFEQTLNLNFPHESFAPASPIELRREATRIRKESFTSKYVGVFLRKGKWAAQVKFKGELYFLGLYDDEEAAARAYDKEKIRLAGPQSFVNFPLEN